MIGIIIFILAILASLVWLWIGGIDYMQKNHPNYRGEDFLDWNDNKIHSEGDF